MNPGQTVSYRSPVGTLYFIRILEILPSVYGKNIVVGEDDTKSRCVFSEDQLEEIPNMSKGFEFKVGDKALTIQGQLEYEIVSVFMTRKGEVRVVGEDEVGHTLIFKEHQLENISNANGSLD